MFEENEIPRLEKSEFYVVRKDERTTIHHKSSGYLRSKRSKLARMFKTTDAALNVLEKFGVNNVNIILGGEK